MYKKIRIVLILIFISIWTCPAGMHTVIVRAATVRTQKLDLSKAADKKFRWLLYAYFAGFHIGYHRY